MKIDYLKTQYDEQNTMSYPKCNYEVHYEIENSFLVYTMF